MMFVVSKRLYNLIMQLVVLALLLGLVIPVRELFIRNVVSYVREYFFVHSGKLIGCTDLDWDS